MPRREPVCFEVSLYIPFKGLDLVEGVKSMFTLPVASKDGSPRFMNFGLSLMMEFARFTHLLGSK